MEPWQIIGLLVGGLLAAAGACNTVGGAVEKILKAWRAAKAPNDAQNRRLDLAEEAIEELKREAEKIRKRLDDSDDGMTIMFKALLALLGNDEQEMKAARAEMQNYLIKK